MRVALVKRERGFRARIPTLSLCLIFLLLAAEPPFIDFLDEINVPSMKVRKVKSPGRIDSTIDQHLRSSCCCCAMHCEIPRRLLQPRFIVLRQLVDLRGRRDAYDNDAVRNEGTDILDQLQNASSAFIDAGRNEDW